MKRQHRAGLAVVLLVIWVRQAVFVLEGLPYSPDAAFTQLVLSAVMLIGLMLLAFGSEK